MEKKKKKDKPADDALHAEEAQATPPTEPTIFEGKVNRFAFIHLNKALRDAWGITKGTEQVIIIELTAEDALLIKKA